MDSSKTPPNPDETPTNIVPPVPKQSLEPEGREAGQEYRYEAFISYRHVEPDRKWAKWLHSALETYRVPKKLVKDQVVAPRIRRIFRDEEELPASADLKKDIEAALKESRFLIVVCSRRTPESEWVNKEVVRFRQMGRDERILALLIEGEPGEAFPRSLREIRRTIVDGQGLTREQIEDVEPLAADVRPIRKENKRHLKRMARLRMLACILGCRFDDLRQREQERHVQRLTVLGALLALILSIMVALTGMAIYQKTEAEHQRDRAEKAAVAEAEQRKRAEDEGYVAKIGFAQSLINECSFESARELLSGCPARYRKWEWGRLQYLCRLDPMTLKGHSYRVVSVAFSPDGNRIASGSYDGTIKVWDAGDGHELLTLKGHDGWVQSVKGHEVWVLCVAFSPDGKRIASGSDDRTIKVWDAGDGRELLTLKGHWCGVPSVTFSPDGKRLASGSWSHDNTIKVWDAESGRELVTLKGHSEQVNSVAFSPDG